MLASLVAKKEESELSVRHLGAARDINHCYLNPLRL
jgi:hypothetical protein